MHRTPPIIRLYLLLAAFLLALPVLGTKFYHGQTGRFLVAAESMRYEPFRESVIYISHNDLFGAFGLIINKPLDASVHGISLPDGADAAWLGGPVAFPQETFGLYASLPDAPEEASPAGETLPAGELWQRMENAPHKRLYYGYSGWGPLQLEIELLQGRWSIIEVPKDVIFSDEDPVALWRRLNDLRASDTHAPGTI
ncbi:MAG: YqgE/AlgH family protein [Rhodospirillales bacterium]|nr:YqgE/AlgH family protein [Rhodospirillales bacterium]